MSPHSFCWASCQAQSPQPVPPLLVSLLPGYTDFVSLSLQLPPSFRPALPPTTSAHPALPQNWEPLWTFALSSCWSAAGPKPWTPSPAHTHGAAGFASASAHWSGQAPQATWGSSSSADHASHLPVSPAQTNVHPGVVLPWPPPALPSGPGSPGLLPSLSLCFSQALALLLMSLWVAEGLVSSQLLGPVPFSLPQPCSVGTPLTMGGGWGGSAPGLTALAPTVCGS